MPFKANSVWHNVRNHSSETEKKLSNVMITLLIAWFSCWHVYWCHGFRATVHNPHESVFLEFDNLSLALFEAMSKLLRLPYEAITSAQVSVITSAQVRRHQRSSYFHRKCASVYFCHDYCWKLSPAMYSSTSASMGMPLFRVKYFHYADCRRFAGGVFYTSCLYVQCFYTTLTILLGSTAAELTCGAKPLLGCRAAVTALYDLHLHHGGHPCWHAAQGAALEDEMPAWRH